MADLTIDRMEYVSDIIAQAVYTSSNSSYLQVYSEPTIKQQGSYSLKIIAAITNSLGEVLSGVLGNSSNLTGVSNLRFDIRASRTGSNIKLKIEKNSSSTYPPANTNTYVKATSYLDVSDLFRAYLATNISNSVIDSWNGNSWLTDVTTNQRFHIDFGAEKVVNKIYYENGHSAGDYLTSGVKSFTFWGSNDADDFADLVYANNGTWVQLSTTQATFDIHGSGNVADPKYIDVSNGNGYRYYAFKFADNYGGPYMCARRIVLQLPGEVADITPNISAADEWQEVAWDISEIEDATKNAVNKIVIEILNADAENTFYLDNFIIQEVIQTNDIFGIVG